ncbi:uncharacterized protein EI90DRAFT_3067925 [Cantharellus anzutake]|uniref:uncharacterized protein n=1 Tax=Cantharellus anzutake TaxID=1750568 RepID=UPI0019064C97|nr:uncharacterized protein EI90DRAFT_3067925 [Cantharellus anzutake]KAF8327465.1 hypothetical protein EI90DRAFT_3067925 [Cantharellus anzutake]
MVNLKLPSIHLNGWQRSGGGLDMLKFGYASVHWASVFVFLLGRASCDCILYPPTGSIFNGRRFEIKWDNCTPPCLFQIRGHNSSGFDSSANININGSSVDLYITLNKFAGYTVYFVLMDNAGARIQTMDYFVNPYPNFTTTSLYPTVTISPSISTLVSIGTAQAVNSNLTSLSWKTSSAIITTTTTTRAATLTSTSTHSATRSSTNVGAIVGGVFGGLALLSLVIVWFLLRRTQENSDEARNPSFRRENVEDAEKQVTLQTRSPAVRTSMARLPTQSPSRTERIQL